MTKRPRKTAKPPEKPQFAELRASELRGMLVLRNRMIIAVAVMGVAGVLLWKPWAPTALGSGKAVAALAPAPAAVVPTPPQRPASLAITAPPSIAEPATPAAFTTAAIATALTTPLPPSPPAASHMPPSLEADFDAWLIDAYRACWSPPGAAPDGDPYYPRVRVSLKADGTLASAPKLVNPPWDPAWKGHADAALKAVKACDPLKVPDKYAPYYTQWKLKTVFFDPTRS